MGVVVAMNTGGQEVGVDEEEHQAIMTTTKVLAFVPEVMVNGTTLVGATSVQFQDTLVVWGATLEVGLIKGVIVVFGVLVALLLTIHVDALVFKLFNNFSISCLR